jgi:hypothetical protein
VNELSIYGFMALLFFASVGHHFGSMAIGVALYSGLYMICAGIDSAFKKKKRRG